MELTSDFKSTFCDLHAGLSVQDFDAIGVASLSSFSAAKMQTAGLNGENMKKSTAFLGSKSAMRILGISP